MCGLQLRRAITANCTTHLLGDGSGCLDQVHEVLPVHEDPAGPCWHPGEKEVGETREVSEDILLDLDAPEDKTHDLKKLATRREPCLARAGRLEGRSGPTLEGADDPHPAEHLAVSQILCEQQHTAGCLSRRHHQGIPPAEPEAILNSPGPVLDNCRALEMVLRDGTVGEIYNVGAANEVTNRFITSSVLASLGAGEEMVNYVTDRPGHDRRYSVATDKIRALGWAPERDFKQALADTVAWYRDNPGWWKSLKERAAP